MFLYSGHGVGGGRLWYWEHAHLWSRRPGKGQGVPQTSKEPRGIFCKNTSGNGLKKKKKKNFIKNIFVFLMKNVITTNRKEVQFCFSLPIGPKKN